MADFWDEDGEADYVEVAEGELEETLEAMLEAYKSRPIPPVLYKMKEAKKIIAICDTETDPFEHGVIVKPFALGFFDGNAYVDFVNEDPSKLCDEFFAFLDAEKASGNEYIIYAHNGGKFDFHFFMDRLTIDQKPLIMGSRMVQIWFGGHEFRDSYSIIPEPLSAYKKDEIDYMLFKPGIRQKHMKAIRDYMKADCLYAYDLIKGFHDMLGDKLTIASAALPMLNSFHGFERMTSDQMDATFRRFYYGGRNQCFEQGLLRPHGYGSTWKVYDRNSMYPAVMKDELHPISIKFEVQREVTDETDFICVDGWNDGALPVRAENGGLDFTCKYGTFYTTIHELRAGLDTGTFRINRVRHAYAFDRKSSFGGFVDHFYGIRLEAKARGDAIASLIYKRVLNSSYGKFALNPRFFKQWAFTLGDEPGDMQSAANPNGWVYDSHLGKTYIWSKPQARQRGFYNVATAASITGAARANLLRSLAVADRPVYCDTDSIICEGFHGDIDPDRLGGWKLEAEGTLAGIAGKKLYTLIDERDYSGGGMERLASATRAPVKLASKGVRLDAAQVLDVCRGQTISYVNPVPVFKMGRPTTFITRRIRKTGIAL